MDTSAAYVKVAKQIVPLEETKIVRDRFHVMQLATMAVERVRKSEHRQLLIEGDEQLVGRKYLWLTWIDNVSDKKSKRFESLYSLSFETGRDWSYKELIRDLLAHDTEKEAKIFFSNWYNRVIRNMLEPMQKIARTLKERIVNIVTNCTQGITNAEGINSKSMSIKRRPGGYRNRNNFKYAIFSTVED